MPKYVTEIGDQAFHGCSSLTEVTMPNINFIKKIGEGIFTGCRNLTVIKYRSSSKAYSKIFKDDFFVYEKINSYSCSINSFLDKNSVVDIPKNINGLNVTKIGGKAFYCCKGLTEITIPDSVTKIGASAFSRCTGLTEVTIPNSVEIIGSCAFGGDIFFYEEQVAEKIYEMNLEKINIADGVKEIGNRAFQYCTNLQCVYINTSKWRIAREGDFLFCAN